MGLRDGGLRESLRAQGLKQGGLRASLRNLNSTGPDIPDSVLDNFNADDADPPGVYQTGETIADYYRGDTGSYERETTDAIEGSHSLATDGDGLDAIVSEPGDGLSRYHDPGETIGFLIRDSSDNHNPVFLFSAELSSGDLFGYGASLVPQFNEIRIRKFDADSGTSQNTASASLSTDRWYWAEVDTPTSTDGSIEFRISELNDDLTEGSSIGSVSTTDTDFGDNRGHGLTRLSSSGLGLTLDWVRVIE